MFPGMGKFDPKKMQAMMKQLGINQEEIEAQRVIIEKPNGKIIIESPSIQKIKMQGQESFQISGEIHEEESGFSDNDVSLVAEKTGKSEDEARSALEETNGDIANAIMRLSE